MSKWPLRTLGDFVSVKHGFAFQSEHFVEESTGLVIVTPGNFAIGGGFKNDKPKWYASNGPLPAEYILQAGLLIVTMTDLSRDADTLGYSALVPNDSLTYLHNQRIGLVQIHNPEQLDKNYLHYVTRSDRYRRQIIATATGTTVHHTAPTRIQQVEFYWPPLSIQRRIGDILGSLDDKIEVNRRINHRLEAMAQALFKHWFVDFGPFQDGSFVETQLGVIPKGWQVGNLGEIARNERVSVDPQEIAGDTAYIGLADMPQGSITLDTWGVADESISGKSVMKRGQILFGKLRPYFKKVGIAPVDGVCSTRAIALGFLHFSNMLSGFSYYTGVLRYLPKRTPR
jgi:type I restriction enzyme S subunit